MRPLSWVIIIVAVFCVAAALLGSKIKLIQDPSAKAEQDESARQKRENKTYIRFADNQDMNGWYAQIPGPNGELVLFRLREQDKRSLDVASEQPSPTPTPSFTEEG